MRQFTVIRFGPDAKPPDFRHAGDFICKSCGQKYSTHPYLDEERDYEGMPFLRVLCDLTVVKL